MIKSVIHTGLVVRNMDKMVHFYHENFGFNKVLDTHVDGEEANNIVGFQIESERIVMMELADKQIELIEYRPVGRDYPKDYKSNDLFGVHLSLETDNMKEDYQRLKENGVKIISQGPQTIPDSHPIFAGTQVLYLQDPEGHPLELMQMPKQ